MGQSPCHEVGLCQLGQSPCHEVYVQVTTFLFTPPIVIVSSPR